MTLQRSAKPIKPSKPRPCKECRKPFIQRNSLHVLCGAVACAIAYGEKSQEKRLLISVKKERQETREKKAASMPLPKRLKLAEKAVNRYVRARDYYEGCCSCDKGSHWDGVWHASHFKSVGSNSRLRFNLWNINKGCDQCNYFKAGNITEYERRLTLKYGLERVEWLKCQNGVTDYSAEYLDRLTRIFNKKALRAEKRIARMA